MPTQYPPRYRVDSLGRAGRAALIVDIRSNVVVLSIGGPDKWTTAGRVAKSLNASRTETPVIANPFGEEN